jgi:hypothetical protein
MKFTFFFVLFLSMLAQLSWATETKTTTEILKPSLIEDLKEKEAVQKKQKKYIKPIFRSTLTPPKIDTMSAVYCPSGAARAVSKSFQVGVIPGFVSVALVTYIGDGCPTP